MNKQKLKAVICAAGIGERLAPLTKDCPKPLLKIGEKTILENMLDNISLSGITEVVIVVGFEAEKIKDKISEKYKNCNIKYIYNKDYKTTNNIYSLWLAKEEIKDGMVFFNGDIIFHSSILINLINDSYRDSIVVDFKCDLFDDAMKARFENDKLVEIGKNIQEKPDSWAIGIYKLSQKTSGRYFEISERLFKDRKNKNISFVAPLQEMCENFLIKGHSVNNCEWIEVDTSEDYEEAKKRIDNIL